jgi:hypothetical protein
LKIQIYITLFELTNFFEQIIKKIQVIEIERFNGNEELEQLLKVRFCGLPIPNSWTATQRVPFPNLLTVSAPRLKFITVFKSL